MAESKNWETTCNRFVAFLDIGGTKNRIASQPAKVIYELLMKVIPIPANLGITDVDVKSNVYYSVFSDSLIFISKDDSKDSLKPFLEVVAFTFASSIKEGLPLKGAISYGEMTADIDNKIFFGQPLVDSYLIQEKIVHYYGAVFDNMFKQKSKSIDLKLDSWYFESTSFYKKDVDDKKINIKEYSDSLSWHLDWFRVLRALNSYDINIVDYAALSNADNIIEKYIKKLYVGEDEKINQCLNNTLAVFRSNKERALEFMKKVELYKITKSNGKEE